MAFRFLQWLSAFLNGFPLEGGFSFPFLFLLRMPLRLVNVVGCGPTEPFKVSEGKHDARRPPLIRANVAIVNNETASASHWYGYFENGASSLSARRTIRGRFCAFAKRDVKIYRLR